MNYTPVQALIRVDGARKDHPNEWGGFILEHVISMRHDPADPEVVEVTLTNDTLHVVLPGPELERYKRATVILRSLEEDDISSFDEEELTKELAELGGPAATRPAVHYMAELRNLRRQYLAEDHLYTRRMIDQATAEQRVVSNIKSGLVDPRLKNQ